MPETVYCPSCHSVMVLRNSKYGWFLGCSNYPVCEEKHCVHQGTKEPMGVPAPKHIRLLRMKAHAAFDELWKKRVMSRRDAYRWLAKALGLPSEDAHIGKIVSEEILNSIVEKSEQRLKEGLCGRC